VPVDSTANEWAKSVTFFSIDRVGQAKWFSGNANDMPFTDINKTKYESGIEMAGIGYYYTLEELGAAMQVPGANLTPERADAARRAYEEFVDRVVFLGDDSKNWEGLINNSVVPAVTATADGTGGNPYWETKSVDQIMRDVNDALLGIYTGSNTVEMADTLLLPIVALSILSTKRIDNTAVAMLDYLSKYNVYTLKTGQQLTIRGVLGLESAGAGATGRMVAYRRDPNVVKVHIPMPHRFLNVWQTGPLRFDVPGIFRLGGVEIRRPNACRYVDGLTEMVS